MPKMIKTYQLLNELLENKESRLNKLIEYLVTLAPPIAPWFYRVPPI